MAAYVCMEGAPLTSAGECTAKTLKCPDGQIEENWACVEESCPFAKYNGECVDSCPYGTVLDASHGVCVSPPACPGAWQVGDCDLTGHCIPASWIGDGYADCVNQQWNANLCCYNNDGGDCYNSASIGGHQTCAVNVAQGDMNTAAGAARAAERMNKASPK